MAELSNFSRHVRYRPRVGSDLGNDANGIYIATDNEGPLGDDLSVFSIPKRHLLGAVPSVARMTRLEGLDPICSDDNSSRPGYWDFISRNCPERV